MGCPRSHRFHERGARNEGAGSASGPAARAAGSNGSHTDESSTYVYSEVGVSRYRARHYLERRLVRQALPVPRFSGLEPPASGPFVVPGTGVSRSDMSKCPLWLDDACVSIARSRKA